MTSTRRTNGAASTPTRGDASAIEGGAPAMNDGASTTSRASAKRGAAMNRGASTTSRASSKAGDAAASARGTAPTTSNASRAAAGAARPSTADAAPLPPLAQRVLGVDDKKTDAGIGASRILDVLGRDRFAETTGVRVDGRVAWLNADLARALGFDVPADGKLTPALEQKILDVCAWRALQPGEDAAGRPTKTFYADRYRGTGMRNEGAARTAFAPEGDLAIKGFGITPLFLPDETKDFQHVHGGAPMREGAIEAVWGEVGENLFAQGSSRILAIIDTGDVTVWPDGSRERRALIIRATHQLRPAHLLAGRDEGGPFTPRVFADAARELGLLVEKKGGGVDHAATMANVMAKHAKAAAEQLRFRVLHGALSTGNMMLDARQLDLATMTALPDTSPAYVLPFKKHHGFGAEHDARIQELTRVWSALVASLPASQRKASASFDPKQSFVQAYVRELKLQLLDAAGLKPGMAAELLEKQPKLVHELSVALVQLTKLHMGGDHDADKQVVRDSVVDVFALLRGWPAHAFGADRTLEGDAAAANALLRPRTDAAADVRAKVDGAARAFIARFDALIAAATPIAAKHYDGVDAMKRSITARAAFENEPMDALFKANAHGSFTRAIDAWQATGDRRAFTETIDKVAAASLRNVEQLLRQGGARAVDGGLDVQMRTIDGVGYAVRATQDGKRRVRVTIPVEKRADGAAALPSLPGAPTLSTAQLDALRYRYTTDGWATTREVPASIEGDRVVFAVPVLKGDAARIEGVFFADADGGLWVKDGSSNFRGYTYAVPDDHELRELQATA